MTADLTDRQSEILAFIRHRIQTGNAPTVREIGTRFAIRSPNAVQEHLRVLEKKNYIIRDRNISRGIRLTTSVAPTSITGFLIGTTDRYGNPVHFGDLLQFDEKEWGGPVEPKRVVLEHGRAGIGIGIFEDIDDWCHVVEHWDGSKPKFGGGGR